LSRSAAVYGCTLPEMLTSYTGFHSSIFDNIDLELSPAAAHVIQDLVGSSMDVLQACTLVKSYPQWLPNWICRASPLWNVSERRTVPAKGLAPAICGFCLMEDLELGRSQYLRLSWHCSITTICPTHLTPLFTCCSASNSKAFAHRQDWSQRGQMYCLECGGAFHHAVCTAAGPQAISAVACLERLLRAGLSGNRLVNLNGKTLLTESLFLFVEDMAWALMLLVASSPYRALHSLRTPAFPVPMGFNTPVESNKWLCCGPLPIRRSIFGVVASLLLPPTPCGTLIPDSGTGIAFWRSVRALQSPEQRRAFRDRTDRWSAELLDAIDFY
jgi:hypothetical protein